MAPARGPLLPVESRARVLLRMTAVALSVPCIFYGLVGAGSTVIVWTLIELDLLRIDFYLSVLAAAGPIAFLVWLERARREASTAGGALYAAALVLNAACVALAITVAAVRGRLLGDATLTGVLALLVVAPALDFAVLWAERTRRTAAPRAAP